MKALSKAEEQLMEVIWQQKKIFMKELLEVLPEPKPAKTTVATLLKRMYDKGVIGYETFGNSRQYFPKISKDDYFSNHLKGLIKNYFGDSSLKFASFFARTNDLSLEELEVLKKIVDDEMKKKK